VNDETIQVVVTPAFRPLLETWLRTRGLCLVQIPPEVFEGTADEDDLPTYIVGLV
jgi:hypothetical protein